MVRDPNPLVDQEEHVTNWRMTRSPWNFVAAS
jgi:hypothetical protein